MPQIAWVISLYLVSNIKRKRQGSRKKGWEGGNEGGRHIGRE